MITRLLRSFGRRDRDCFPEDENGDILFGIWKEGGDLSTPRPVDFSLIFLQKQQAEAFAQLLASRKGKIEVSYFEEKRCWDLRFSPIMVPSWANITKMERWLGETVQEYEGENDGWGFLSA
jgi:hypothetical protein